MITSKNKRISISLIIPCFNSRKYIIKNILFLKKKLKNYNYNLIIIDDGSLDGTYNLLVNHFKKNKNIKIYKNSTNKGKGYSIKKGFKLAKGEFIFFIDADLPYIDRLEKFLLKLINSDNDILIAKRVNSLKSDFLFGIRDKFSNLFSLFCKFFFNIPFNDTQAGLKGFRKNEKI